MRTTARDRSDFEAKFLDEPTQIALAQRDPRAFAPLYETYADAVYRYCYRRLGNPDSAADATSVVFTRALTALPRYHDRSFRSWLFTIAHNTIIDGWRTTRLESGLETGVGSADPAPGPEEAAVNADADRHVHQLLTHLPPDQRHVVELRLAGLTNQEIAATLGRSVAATKMLQFRALTRLRTLLCPEPASLDGGRR